MGSWGRGAVGPSGRGGGGSAGPWGHVAIGLWGREAVRLKGCGEDVHYILFTSFSSPHPIHFVLIHLILSQTPVPPSHLDQTAQAKGPTHTKYYTGHPKPQVQHPRPRPPPSNTRHLKPQGPSDSHHPSALLLCKAEVLPDSRVDLS